jgi:hypothetical protein
MSEAINSKWYCYFASWIVKIATFVLSAIHDYQQNDLMLKDEE